MPPPGKRLPITPQEFLKSLGGSGDSSTENDAAVVIDEKDPMKAVENFVDDSVKEGLRRDASAARSEKPPDLRVNEISAEGELYLRFTSEMEEIPSADLLQAMNDERRRLEATTDGIKIDLVYFPGVEDRMKANI